MFLHDVLACSCGGRRRLLVFLSDQEVTRKILRHLGLPGEPPALAPPGRRRQVGRVLAELRHAARAAERVKTPRLGNGAATGLGLFDALKSDGVAAVEWADKLPPGALSEALEIRFEIGDGDRRTLRFSAYGQEASSLLKSLN